MTMRDWFPGLAVGLLFGAGLALSDMVNPARVLAFLDLAGAWDPSLAFVMVGALIPSAVAYAVARRVKRPLMADRFRIPPNRAIDGSLLAGSALFGIGWGLAGLCPGPAIAGLALGRWQYWMFAAAMLAGVILHKFAAARRPAPKASTAPTGA